MTLVCIAFHALLMFLSLAGATNVPLSTAETTLLAYFPKKGTLEIKREKHLLPLCHDLKLKNFKSKDKTNLIIAVAKQLLYYLTNSNSATRCRFLLST